ncbi:MAG TPA: hypothetical protein VGC89_15560 [Pyrinomonadaceae bacterium]
MATENLISTLEQSLRQARAARTRLAARLAELEAEAETVRAELNEMDTLTGQTEAAIFRLLSSVLSANSTPQPTAAPSDAELEAALRHDTSRPAQTQARGVVISKHHIPPLRNDVAVKDDRFADRTISYAATALLRESREPLHVNEIYNRLLEGGFNFTGHNPTISIAVSLNRNPRFRKVAPGTFDLVMRDASQAS